MEYFTFNGICSRDINMYIVNDAEGYQLTQYLPNINHSFEITNKYIIDGGSYYGERIITFRVVAETDNPIEYIKDMSRWLDVQEFTPISFSREPFKQYYVKRYGEFSPQVYSDMVVCNLQFIALNYLAYSTFTTSEIKDEYYYDDEYYLAGLNKDACYTHNNITGTNQTFKIYHGGNNDECRPIITIKGTFNKLTLTNTTTGESCLLDYNISNGTVVIDCENQCIYVNDVYNVAGHTGDFFTLQGRKAVFTNQLSIFNQSDGDNVFQLTSPNQFKLSCLTFDFRYVYN
jgi:phage-related protein